MDSNEAELMLVWSERLVSERRLTFLQGAEGWLASIDGLPMSYGETKRVATTWAFIMAHKSAYE